MDGRNRAWHWVVAAVVTVFLGGASAIAAFTWYVSTAISVPDFTLTDAGVAVVAPTFGWSSLVGIAPPAIMTTLLCAAAGFGLYHLFGRRRGPAIMAAALGPITAFVLLMAAVVYTRFFDLTAGQEYLGSKPAVLLGYTVATLVPAIVGFIAVLVAGRKGDVAPDAPAGSV